MCAMCVDWYVYGCVCVQKWVGVEVCIYIYEYVRGHIIF